MKLIFILLVQAGFAKLGRREAERSLPGATPLIFDGDLPLLPSLTLKDPQAVYWNSYRDVDVLHFRRVPIAVTLPRDRLQSALIEDPQSLTLRVSIELTSPGITECPVVLIERKRFGGALNIRHDSSNFCDWLHGLDPRRTGVSIGTSLKLHPQGAKVGWSASNYANDEFVMYIGFSGVKTQLRRVDFTLSATLELTSEPDFQPACAAFQRFDQAPSATHALRSTAVPGLAVIAKDFIVRKWVDLPTSKDLVLSPGRGRLGGYSVDVLLTKNKILALGLDMPGIDSKNPVAPVLLISGPRPGEVDVLIGSYHAQSIWELQRFHQFAKGNFSDEEPTTWAVPLKGTLQHLQRHASFLAPPGSSLLVLMLPRVPHNVPTHITTLLLSSEHQVGSLQKNTLALDPTPLVVNDHSPPPHSTLIFGSMRAYTTFVRSALFTALGLAAALGVARALWVVLSEAAARDERPRYTPAWLQCNEGNSAVHRKARSLNLQSSAGFDGEKTPLRATLQDTTVTAAQLHPIPTNFEISSAQGSHRSLV